MVGKFNLAAGSEVNEVDFGRLSWLSNPKNTHAANLTVIDGVIYPGKGHDFHKHPDQEELIFVLAGRIEQWIEGEKRVLNPGESAFVPADTVHASFNAGSDEAKVLAILSPCVGEGGIAMVDMSGDAPWNALRQHKGR